MVYCLYEAENKHKLGGPVSVALSTRKIAIGKDIATKVIVKGGQQP